MASRKKTQGSMRQRTDTGNARDAGTNAPQRMDTASMGARDGDNATSNPPPWRASQQSGRGLRLPSSIWGIRERTTALASSIFGRSFTSGRRQVAARAPVQEQSLQEQSLQEQSLQEQPHQEQPVRDWPLPEQVATAIPPSPLPRPAPLLRSMLSLEPAGGFGEPLLTETEISRPRPLPEGRDVESGIPSLGLRDPTALFRQPGSENLDVNIGAPSLGLRDPTGLFRQPGSGNLNKNTGTPSLGLSDPTGLFRQPQPANFGANVAESKMPATSDPSSDDDASSPTLWLHGYFPDPLDHRDKNKKLEYAFEEDWIDGKGRGKCDCSACRVREKVAAQLKAKVKTSERKVRDVGAKKSSTRFDIGGENENVKAAEFTVKKGKEPARDPERGGRATARSLGTFTSSSKTTTGQMSNMGQPVNTHLSISLSGRRHRVRNDLSDGLNNDHSPGLDNIPTQDLSPTSKMMLDIGYPNTAPKVRKPRQGNSSTNTKKDDKGKVAVRAGSSETTRMTLRPKSASSTSSAKKRSPEEMGGAVSDGKLDKEGKPSTKKQRNLRA